MVLNGKQKIDNKRPAAWENQWYLLLIKLWNKPSNKNQQYIIFCLTHNLLFFFGKTN